uniref:(northern house mosquito) hypothetical protein n=1 Tax=Culex pipiens TaxID=7175 RepID=A0A8D8NPD6_CULPI
MRRPPAVFAERAACEHRKVRSGCRPEWWPRRPVAPVVVAVMYRDLVVQVQAEEEEVVESVATGTVCRHHSYQVRRRPRRCSIQRATWIRQCYSIFTSRRKSSSEAIRVGDPKNSSLLLQKLLSD